MGKQIYINDIGLYLPDKLKEDIDILLDDVMYGEMDLLIIIDGKEGSGKSYDARLLGKYCSYVLKTPFGVNNIHFTADSYIKFSESNPKFTVNIFDESREALNKKRGMSKSNVGFTNYLSENRDKQQVHIILLPAIHDLDSYVAIWRMRLLIHKLLGHVKDDSMRSGYKLLRGYFKVYENSKTLQQVMYNKAKYGYYAYPKEFKYKRKIKYTQVLTDTELKEYKDKKAIERRKKYDETQKNNKKNDKLHRLVYNLNKKQKLSQEEIARNMELSRTVVGNIIRDFEDIVTKRQD